MDTLPDFPPALKKRYDAIAKRFEIVSKTYDQYPDDLIPEDPTFVREIIGFIISVIEHMHDHIFDIDLDKYREFLAFYEYDFFYGPSGDDHNLLNLNEQVDGMNVAEFCFPLKDKDFPLDQNALLDIKDLYLEALDMLGKRKS